jgi:SET domain-containing protein
MADSLAAFFGILKNMRKTTVEETKLEDPNCSKVYLADTADRGRGVFAQRKIKKQEVIERAPVIVVPRKEWETMDETVLSNYIFDWGENDEDAAVALGYVSIYNHSYSPNAELQELLDNNLIEVIALKDIQPGEEICVNYNGAPDDRDELWFDVVDNAIK